MKQILEKLIEDINKRHEYWRKQEHERHSIESETREHESLVMLLMARNALNTYNLKFSVDNDGDNSIKD